MKVSTRLAHAWNAFMSREPTNDFRGGGSHRRPDKIRLSAVNERSVIVPVFNRIANDIASIAIHHVRQDSEGKFRSIINSGIEDVLNSSANKDQNSRDFMKDLVLSMFDEGCVAVVPVDTDTSIVNYNSFDILSMRVGRIVEWFPNHVRVDLYNDNTGQRQQIALPKSSVAIIENPFYSVMNEPNSTARRLVQKLNLLDNSDRDNNQGKLDLIIQLPYSIKSQARREMAEERRKDIEMQLSGSKYGIAYTDGTERITQLNRPVENRLMEEVTYLTDTLYKQLGMTPAIFDGTADEATILNYHNTTLMPILDTIVLEFKRKFLTKTARTQGQTFMYFRDPFKLMPISALADTADKLTRNAILSSNEVRTFLGYKPVDDAKADELSNKNIAQPNDGSNPSTVSEE